MEASVGAAAAAAAAAAAQDLPQATAATAAVPPSPADAGADWPGADKFVAVQVLLDQNVVLINQINDNHAARSPEALQRNVVLIRELNSNVQKIVGLYQELAAVLTGNKAVEGSEGEDGQRRAAMDAAMDAAAAAAAGQQAP